MHYAWAAARLSKFADARVYLAEAFSTDSIYDRWRLVVAGVVDADCARLEGRLDYARDAFEQALTKTQALGLSVYEAASHLGLSQIAASVGDQALAKTHAEQSASIYRRIGHLKASIAKRHLANRASP